jgi:uncharacterized membrane protein YcaP (DUF421 family)
VGEAAIHLEDLLVEDLLLVMGLAAVHQVEGAQVAIGEMQTIIIIVIIAGVLIVAEYFSHKETMARIQNGSEEIESEKEDE